ncbi:MAG: RNA methyltransferase [Burkholderiaceae bacterium]
MKTISSRDNPLYKELKLLATSSQARRKAGRTLLDGIHLAQAYLQQVGQPVWCVLAQGATADPEAAALAARCAQCLLLPDALYKGLSQVEHGVGLLFVVETLQPRLPPALAEPAVLLDRLQDPGNLGSILRSAAAAGIRQVYCSAETVFAWSPKVLRAGMGAHFLLDIFENVDLETLLRGARVPVLATSSYASATLYETDLRRPAAWLFGHEGQGVAPALLALAARQVKIPQAGGIESLNVAAAAAVCLFEQLRQTRGA